MAFMMQRKAGGYFLWKKALADLTAGFLVGVVTRRIPPKSQKKRLHYPENSAILSP
jgi:hypothetical protein